jgi:hypothetical protein
MNKEITKLILKLRKAVEGEVSGQHPMLNRVAWNKVEDSFSAMFSQNQQKYGRDPRLDPIGAKVRKTLNDRNEKEIILNAQRSEIEDAHLALDAEGVPRKHQDDEGTPMGFSLKQRINLLLDRKREEHGDNLKE